MLCCDVMWCDVMLCYTWACEDISLHLIIFQIFVSTLFVKSNANSVFPSSMRYIQKNIHINIYVNLMIGGPDISGTGWMRVNDL